MLALEHDVLLEFGVLDLVVFDQDILPDDFDGVQLFVPLELGQEDLAESALAQHDDHLEVGKIWFSVLRVLALGVRGVDQH